MKQPLYILSSCSISAQHTYNADHFLDPVVSRDDGHMYVIDPDYTRYISPVAIRRMSRFLKRGITAGMKCLEDAGVATPDGIILSTARGSVTDLENFLKDMIRLNEEALTPTAFIQSTYNSINGWIAMLTKCTGYNQTYVHRGFSLELTLFDAQMMFAESTGKKYILAGGFDELTPDYFMIRNKIGYYKENIPNNLSLLAHYDTPGSIAGEGAHFFTVTNDPENAACAIPGLEMLQQPSAERVQNAIADMLQQNGLTNDDIDILVSGMNGDSRNRFLTDPLIAKCSPNTTIAIFKHLSGEYDTVSGFGLWLADYIIRKQHIPAEVIYKQGGSKTIRNILICNVTIGCNISLMLVRKNDKLHYLGNNIR
ncbi:MAG: beta-ketoacyl synthase chain length factor [Chitinophagales bacterium]